MSDQEFQIDASLIDNQAAIDTRVAELPEAEREISAVVLRYLYMTGGPKSIPRDKKWQAEKCLTPVEHFVFQWLYKRTDGKLRRLYGAAVLPTIKKARYQCERCGFADVRALNLEKRQEDEETTFLCLCANCNTVDARAKEMSSNTSQKVRAAQEEAP